MKAKQYTIASVLALGLVLILAWLLAGARIPGAQAAPQSPTANVIYVDADAAGPADGLTWSTAYTNVQDALTSAGPGDDIWVAEGVYTPGGAGDRTATFQLKDGVALYGGFAATETLRTQRDWETHVTVLSGDLDGNDVTDANGVVTDTANIVGANAYHVTTGSGVTETARLDGFVITAGKADGSYSPFPSRDRGGGMHNVSGSPTLTNVTFSGNYAAGMYSDGGGMCNYYNSNPKPTNVTFSGNSASYEGGGMHNYSSSPELTNVTFNGNSASYGGGMYTSGEYSGLELTNVTFSGNSASSGGGMYNYDNDPTLDNCILWDNTASSSGLQSYNAGSTPAIAHSLIQGSGGSGGGWDATLGTDGGGNIDADPQFLRDPNPGFDGTWGTADDDYGDLRLGLYSPAIDAGNNGAVPSGIITDLGGNSRFFDVPFIADTGNGTAPIVDMGAYEAPWQQQRQILLPLVLRGSN